MTQPTLTPDSGYMGDPKRGASMGRRSTLTNNGHGKLYLRRVHINLQGYDSGGAYWGAGEPLYWATNGGTEDVFLRARDRDDAKAKLRQQIPGVEFYR